LSYLYQAVLKAQADVLSCSHPETLKTLADYGSFLTNTGDANCIQAGLRCYESAFAGLNKRAGPTHAKSMQVLETLIETCDQNEAMITDGRQLGDKYRRLLEEVHPGSSPSGVKLFLCFDKTVELHVPHVPTAKPGFKSQRGQAVFIFSRLN
jgi:hypothetical protein